MNEGLGPRLYSGPTNPSNCKKALRECLGSSDSIENFACKQPQRLSDSNSIEIINLKIKYLGVFDSIDAFSKEESTSPGLSLWNRPHQLFHSIHTGSIVVFIFCCCIITLSFIL